MEKQPPESELPLRQRLGQAALKGLFVLASGFRRIGQGFEGISRGMGMMAEGLDRTTRGLTGTLEERMDSGLTRLDRQVADFDKKAADFGNQTAGLPLPPGAILDHNELGLSYHLEPPAPGPGDDPTPSA